MIAKKIVIFSAILVIAGTAFLPMREIRAQNWLDQAQEGGLNAVGSEAYGETGAPERSLQGIITAIIRIFLGFLGLIFLIMVILGGFKWMTAGGSEEKIKEATAQIRNGIIGLLIILCAYSITAFISNRVVPKVVSNSSN